MVFTDPEFDRPEFLPNNMTAPKKINIDETGDFGINIQLGYPGGKKVGIWSEEGEQVFSTKDELNGFFALCEKHEELYGNKFSYTLATRPDFDEAQKTVQTNNAVPVVPPEKIDTLPPKAAGTLDNKATSDGIQAPPPPIERKVEEEVPVEEKDNAKKDETTQEPKKSTKTLNPILLKVSNNVRFGGTDKSGTKQLFNPELLESKKILAEESLDDLALIMRENPGWKIEIAAYKLSVDSLRTAASNTAPQNSIEYKSYMILNKYNQGGKEIEDEVTMARANTVKEYLISKGVSAGQITTIASITKNEAIRSVVRIKVTKEDNTEVMV
jgi:outer membrane protein OmpA-like peptidoglycan-associated protein